MTDPGFFFLQIICSNVELMIIKNNSSFKLEFIKSLYRY